MKYNKTAKDNAIADVIHAINGLWKPTPLHVAGTTDYEREYNAHLVACIGCVTSLMETFPKTSV